MSVAQIFGENMLLGFVVEFFKRLFAFPESKEVVRKSKARRARFIVSTLSSGNVLLQQGKYITQTDIQRMRKSLL
jgi:hypothetical protein